MNTTRPARPKRIRPELLYLPDADDIAPPPPAKRPLPPEPVPRSLGRCPADMVDVAGRFCIDRYEAILVDAATGRQFSPYYHPAPAHARRSRDRWSRHAHAEGGRYGVLPELPAWQLEPAATPQAVSRAFVIPQGYMNATKAAEACGNAGKRLCTAEEWKMACRGQQGRKFPYGDHYEHGRCNIFRDAHPAVLVHGNASVGHQDPRLNTVEIRGERLLRPTGATPGCRSEWGRDAVYDMVGNLDEWVDDPGGAFHGGFFSRGTREGCDARISSHSPAYFDYSLGVRCCR